MKEKLLRFWPILFIFIVWFVFSSPFFLKNLVPFSSTYLVNFFSPWNAYSGFAGPVKNNAMPDVLNQIYPWKKFTIETFLSGQFPIWNPYSFSGTPHLANYQSAVLSPFNILFFVLPFIDAWSLLILLAPLLAGIFTYLFVRSLSASKIGSTISAISFMLCGFIITWLSYGTLSYAILFAPLALFAIEKFYQDQKFRYLTLLALTIPLDFFSGHFQISIYFLIIVIVYALYKFINTKNLLLFSKIISTIFLGILICAVQLLPTIELYLQSLRSSIFSPTEIIPWSYLPTLIAPDFFGNPVTRNDWLGHYAEWSAYIGVVPLMLSVYSLTIKKKSQTFFLFFFGIISLLFGFNSPLISIIAKLHIPVISTSAVSRIVAIYCFMLACASAFGFDQLRNDISKNKFRKLALFLLAVLLFFGILWSLVGFKIFIPVDKVVIARNNLVFPTLIFALFSLSCFSSLILKNKKALIVFGFLILIVTSADLLRFAVKWQPFDPKRLVYPTTPIVKEFKEISGQDRVLGNLGGEAMTYYNLQSLEGYDALYIKRYGEFVASIEDGEIKESPRSVVVFPKNGKYTFPAMNLLGVKYIVHKVADSNKVWTFPVWKFSENNLTLIYNDGVYQVFKNNSSLPRAFLTTNYKVENDKQKIIDELFNSKESLRTLILEKNPNFKQSGPIVEKTEITEYRPNNISVKYDSKTSAILFLSDNYYPGWKAYIDGKEQEILRADYTFRAVVVPGGNHSVKFKYQPESFKIGVFVSVFGVITLCLWGLIKRKEISF